MRLKMEAKCEKCQKVFTHPKFQSKANQKLESHLNRKNSCDGSTGDYILEKTSTFKIPDMDTLDMECIGAVVGPNLRYTWTTSAIFKVLLDTHKFATIPNIKKDEIFYMLDGRAMMSTPTKFVLDFWLTVMTKRVWPILKTTWELSGKFANYIGDNHGSVLGVPASQIQLNKFLRSKAFQDMKAAIIGHLKTFPRSERTQIRINMGSRAEERVIVFKQQA
jgi:hypothetical protein